MTAHLLLNLTLSFQILIFVAALGSYGLRWLTQNKIVEIKPSLELSVHLALIILVFVLPVVFVNTAEHLQIEPIKKSYTALTYQDFKKQKSVGSKEFFVIGKTANSNVVSVEAIQKGMLYLILLSILFSLAKLRREFKYLNQILLTSHPWRTLGRLRVVVSQQITIPFSLHSLRTAWVVLPSQLLAATGNSRIAILHEIQHHRQKDTLWLYIFQILQVLAGFNPALRPWLKVISEVQELKVDEVLVDRKKINPREYARCLIAVAESVVMGERELACATGLAFLPDRQQLQRRIESMFTKRITNRANALAISLCLMSLLTTTAMATSRVVGPGRISMVEAQRMATNAQKDSEIPIVVNDLVLKWLNYYLGTAQGRDTMRVSLERMKDYQSIIEKKLQEYNVPQEVLALPIIESGYQNLQQGKRGNRGAGLWQFIPETARNFNLVVDDEVDDRLDIEKETDAAMRLLASNKVRFRTWELSALAFNSGEGVVTEGVRKTKSYDAWALIRNGYENDTGYLPKFMAAIIIMKNPSALN